MKPTSDLLLSSLGLSGEWELAFHEDLDEAVYLALESMVKLMHRRYSLSRLDAIAIASVAVDFRITQVVNQVKGVHAVLPYDAIKYA